MAKKTEVVKKTKKKTATTGEKPVVKTAQTKSAVTREPAGTAKAPVISKPGNAASKKPLTADDKNHVVVGKVTYPDSTPATGLTVIAYDKDVFGKDRLGQPVVTNELGAFAIPYSDSDFRRTKKERGGADVIVCVYNAKQELLFTSKKKNSAPSKYELKITVPAQPFVVRGKVRFADGTPLAGALVRAYDKDLRSKEPLGESEPVTTDTKGWYEIFYTAEQFSRAEKHNADLLVRVLGGDGSTLAESPIRFNSSANEIIDLTLAEGAPALSEYELLIVELAPVLQDVPLHELTAKEIDFLSGDTGQDRQRIALLVEAWKRSVESGIKMDDRLISTHIEKTGKALSPELLYGLGRQNIPLSWTTISTIREKEMAATLRQSILENIISGQQEDVILTFLKMIGKIATLFALTKPTDKQDAILGKALKIALGDEKLGASFLEHYRIFEGKPEEFWKNYLPQQPEFLGKPDLIQALQLTNQLAFLTDIHLPLMEELQTNRGIKDIKALLNLTPQDWKGTIKKVGLPDGSAAADDTEKADIYIKDMTNMLHATYPTETIANMVRNKTLKYGNARITEGLNTFFEKAKDFDIATSNIHQYDGIFKENNQKNAPEIKEKLQILQRIYQVSPTPDAMAIMIHKGLDSAYQIATMPEQVFLATFGDVLGETQALAVHDRATYNVTRLQNVLMTVREALDSNSPQATPYFISNKLPQVTPVSPSPEIATSASPLTAAVKKHFSNYEDLFGGANFCECRDCRSVYSPAAYFVDLLQFLDKKCKSNQATPKHSPLDTLLKRRPDLEFIPLTCENTNTEIPYIDLVNEVMEYYVANGHIDKDAAHDTGDVSVAELRANPQYTMNQAYNNIKDALYPFNLPYHQPLDVIRTYLRHLQISRGEMMETFRTDLTAIGARRANYAEYMDLCEEEYKILTGKDFDGVVSVQNLWDFYGYSNQSDLKAKIVKVPEFLKKTGIKYTDLIELVKTKFINPHQVVLDYIEGIFKGTDIDSDTLYAKLNVIAGGGDDNQISVILLTEYATFKIKMENDFSKLQKVITLYEPDSKCALDSTDLRSLGNIYEPLILSNSAIADDTISKIHRFIRLWRKTGWTIPELDNLITALGEAEITPVLIEKLAYIKRINARLKLPLNQLACLWGNIETYGSKSLYSQLFLSRGAQKIDIVFLPDKFGNYLGGSSAKIKDHLPAVLAAFRISAEQLSAIATDCLINLETTTPAPLTIANLSAIYRYVVLSRALKVSIADLCDLRSLLAADPFDHTNLANTSDFIKIVQKVKTSGFKVPILKYIFNGYVDPSTNIAISDQKILQSMKSIREGLQKVEQEHPEKEPVTEELVQKKLSMIFSQDVVLQFIAMLKGDVIYSTDTVKNPNIVIPDNLKEKIIYIKTGTSGRLHCRGVLSDADKTALNVFIDTITATTPEKTQFKNAVMRIYEKPEQFIRDSFSGIYTDLTDLGNAYKELLDHPAQATPLILEQKLNKFYESYLPHLKKQLRKDAIIQSVSSAIGLDEPMTAILIGDQVESIRENLSEAGFSGKYYISVAAPDPMFERIDKEINFSWADKAPDTRLPADGFTVHWAAFICPPVSGEYTFIAEVEEADEIISVSLDGQNIREKATMTAGNMYKLVVAYTEGTGNAGVRLYWQGEQGSREIIPAQLLYPETNALLFSNAIKEYHRAAFFINGFKLEHNEVAYFLNHKIDFGDLDYMALTPTHWERIYDYTSLRSAIPQNIASLIDVFDAAVKTSPPPLLTEILDRVVLATQWDPAQLTFLAGTSGFNLQNQDFKNEIALIRIQKALKMIRSTGVDAKTLLEWANIATDFDTLETISQSVKQTVRAKYEEEKWLEVAKGLSNKIRENQKQALISYLLQQKSLQDWGVEDADGLFEYFLIDVQMGACMDTSRIKQAISSVQLFVTRCLINLESKHDSNDKEVGVSPDQIIKKQQWEWMKNFRVWEANRKIFLYPENWLDPELRDDKSPFFKELESELLQNDITDRTVENAFRNYLTKLDQVSNLELCGMHEDLMAEMIHVFARTHAAPYQYFYRTRDKYDNWSAWEKVQLDIRSVEDDQDSANSGVHLIPVVWKKRLFLFWPEFMKKQAANANNKTDSLTKLAEKTPDQLKATEYWEIRLAWSEYDEGKWSPKQLSKDFITIDTSDLPRYFRLYAYERAYEGQLSFSISNPTTPDPTTGTTNIHQTRVLDVNPLHIKSTTSDYPLSQRIYDNSIPVGYTSCFMFMSKDGSLKLNNNDYLTLAKSHKIMFSHNHFDFVQSKFFYQDDYRTYFVTPEDVPGLIEMSIVPFFTIITIPAIKLTTDKYVEEEINIKKKKVDPRARESGVIIEKSFGGDNTNKYKTGG